jgi:four helix bundle protein
MASKNIIKDKSFDFAISTVRLYQKLTAEKREFVISKQLLRSGTSVGALIREAEQGQSKKDFIHKLSIAQKEINETLYWLELLNATEFIDIELFQQKHDQALEILKLLTAIIKTTKSRIVENKKTALSS